jgi:cytoskeletal protein CcmA (bactofilin family)
MALFNNGHKGASSTQLGAVAQQPATTVPPSERLNAARPVETEAKNYLSKETKVTGKLVFEGPARIDGQIDGEIKATDRVVIGQAAVVTAPIIAKSVSIEGKVNGDIIASHRVEIHPTARVRGNITAPVLVVQEGAFLEGHCGVQPDWEHKVAVFPKDEDERVAQNGAYKEL